MQNNTTTTTTATTTNDNKCSDVTLGMVFMSSLWIGAVNKYILSW